ncbi:MAG TPA: metal ABC transporter substrate-binding protein [Gemmatimonadaceae bacterium]|nr:metal ABC transporter substrate-binding protein [Gemmatimonadaceae bacterium]
MKHNRMVTIASIALVALSGMGAVANDKLRVVATTPDLASIAREIGGDAIDVVALAKPTEDAHFVDAKPSHIVTLNRADVLIEGGAELELGWLPPLLESARNTKIAPGAPGRIVASQGIRMLEIPTSFDRSKGDVHSRGNPHFLTDPMNAKIVAANIADHLAQVDPDKAAVFKANLTKFDAAVDAKLTQWQQQLTPFSGAKIVTYHKDFPYFAERFHIEIVENLEPKPGIAPSPAHLAKVIETMKSATAHVIVVQPYQNIRTAETVARQTDAVVLNIPQQPGARKEDTTYVAMMDYMVSTLAHALSGK